MNKQRDKLRDAAKQNRLLSNTGTADLLDHAADEIDRLSAELQQLQSRFDRVVVRAL